MCESLPCLGPHSTSSCGGGAALAGDRERVINFIESRITVLRCRDGPHRNLAGGGGVTKYGIGASPVLSGNSLFSVKPSERLIQKLDS